MVLSALLATRVPPPSRRGGMVNYNNYSTNDVHYDSQVFTSTLVKTSTHKTSCFAGYIGNRPFDGKERVTSSSGQVKRSPSSMVIGQFGRRTSSVGSVSRDTSQASLPTSVLNSGSSILQGLMSLAQKTVVGSAEDIGWLQRDPCMLPVEDGTKRFMELLENIRNNEHKLPSTMVYLLIPGFLSSQSPSNFTNVKTCFSRMGLDCHIAVIHSEASTEKRAQEINNLIEEIYCGSKKRVLILGHSKGGVDAAAALSIYWSDLKDKVAGLALAHSPYGGNPFVSDLLREGQFGDYVIRRLLEDFMCNVLKGDMRALEDMTYKNRREFLRKHPLPRELPVVSFHTQAGFPSSILDSFSRVAHAELPPIVTPLGDGRPTKVPVAMPLPVLMAMNAQVIRARYGEENDGLVTRRDAEAPGSVAVRTDRKLDHSWMLHPSLNGGAVGGDDPSRACEALLTLLVEVAQRRR